MGLDADLDDILGPFVQAAERQSERPSRLYGADPSSAQHIAMEHAKPRVGEFHIELCLVRRSDGTLDLRKRGHGIFDPKSKLLKLDSNPAQAWLYRHSSFSADEDRAHPADDCHSSRSAQLPCLTATEVRLGEPHFDDHVTPLHLDPVFVRWPPRWCRGNELRRVEKVIRRVADVL
jgi:hypothetical protein